MLFGLVNCLFVTRPFNGHGTAQLPATVYTESVYNTNPYNQHTTCVTTTIWQSFIFKGHISMDTTSAKMPTAASTIRHRTSRNLPSDTTHQHQPHCQAPTTPQSCGKDRHTHHHTQCGLHAGCMLCMSSTQCHAPFMPAQLYVVAHTGKATRQHPC